MSGTSYIVPGVVLDAHQADRRDGATVVSIIAGPRHIARAAFVGWCAAMNMHHVVAPSGTPAAAERALGYWGAQCAVLFAPAPGSAWSTVAAASVLARRRPSLPVAVLSPFEEIRQALAGTDHKMTPEARARAIGGLVAANPDVLKELERDALRPEETPLYRSDHEQVLHLLMRYDDAIRDLFRVNQKVKVGRLRRFEIDFWCESLRLAIEIDGLQHEQQRQRQRDSDRDQSLAGAGIRSHRIRAGMVMRDPTAVIRFVRQLVDQRRQELAS